jgi:hypothetical protein
MQLQRFCIYGSYVTVFTPACSNVGKKNVRGAEWHCKVVSGAVVRCSESAPQDEKTMLLFVVGGLRHGAGRSALSFKRSGVHVPRRNRLIDGSIRLAVEVDLLVARVYLRT